MDFTAAYFEDEVEVALSALTSMLEPLLMVVIGVLVGGIVICMFLPIFQMPAMAGGG
jgi:type IV pilus assembly protein PilC